MSRPTMAAIMLWMVNSALGPWTTRAPSRRTAIDVGEPHDVAQDVGDVDDRLAGLVQPVDDLEEAIGLARRQRGGGLVEDEDAGVHGERLGDLDELPLAGREALHLHVGRDVQVHHGQELLGAPADLAPAQQRHLAHGREVADEEVLGDGEVGEEVQLLVDEGDAGAVGIARVARRVDLAVQQHLARVERHDAAQDVHERGLAGAVLADQADDAAALDVEGDALQDRHAEEGLADVLEAQDGVCHLRPPHALCSRMRRRATSMRAAKRMTEPFTMAT